MKRTIAIATGVAAGVLAAGVLLVGYSRGDGPKPVVGSFTGKVAGTSALVGIVGDGEHVRAYVCDGRRIGRWFTSSDRDGAVDLRAGGLRLQARLTAAGGSGTLTLKNGSSHRIRLESARGNAGLYQGEATYEGVAYLGRWVVASDGGQAGRVSTSIVSPIPVTLDAAVRPLSFRGGLAVATLATPSGSFEMAAVPVVD